MKFKGESNLFVRIVNKRNQRLIGKKGFYFDHKGEYETDNVNMIALLKQNFEVVEDDANIDTDINIDADIEIQLPNEVVIAKEHIEETETAEEVIVEVEETKPKPRGRVK